MTDARTMEEYLGILIMHVEEGSFKMSQPHLIDILIESIPGIHDARSETTPASAGITLTKDETGEPRKEHWNYMSVIGMLKYLVKCTRTKKRHLQYTNVLGSVIVMIQNTVMNKQ